MHNKDIIAIKFETDKNDSFKNIYSWYFTVNNIINKIVLIEYVFMGLFEIYDNTKYLYSSKFFDNITEGFEHKFILRDINYKISERDNTFSLYIEGINFNEYLQNIFNNNTNDIDYLENIDIVNNIKTPFDF